MQKQKTIEVVLQRAEIEATLNPESKINVDIYKATGDRDYEHLVHLPTINGVTVIGDKISHDYHLADEGETLSLYDTYSFFDSAF